MKLPRQKYNGHDREQRHSGKSFELRAVSKHRRGVGALHRLREQCRRSIEQPESDEHADGEERHQLDDRLRCDRQHQAVLVLGGIDVACAEQHRESRHRQRDEQGHVAEHHLLGASFRRDVDEDGSKRRRHRFELQCDVGNRPDDRDQRDGGRHRLILAVARRDEIRDRGDVVGLGQPHDPHDQRPAEPDHQHRPDIDREEVIAGARSQPHRSKERPGRAIDRERERIDQQAQPALAAELPEPIAVTGNHEQQADVAKRDRDNDPAVEHCVSCVTLRRTVVFLRYPGSPYNKSYPTPRVDVLVSYAQHESLMAGPAACQGMRQLCSRNFATLP